MYTGYYTNLDVGINTKYKKKNPRIALIMPVYVGSQARTHYTIIDETKKKEVNIVEDKLELIKFTIKCIKHFKTDLNYELILIDNGTESEEAIEYYKTLPYRVIRRKNEGFSFGAWKYAWEKLKKKYDYYLFFEADYAPCKDYWLEEIYEEFHKSDDIGAVGNVLETMGRLPYPKHIEINTKSEESKFTETEINKYLEIVNDGRDYIINLDGCYTFTSREIIEQVYKNGEFRVLPCGGGKRHEDSKASTTNELLFQQPILNLGYKIVAFGLPDFSKCERIYFYGIRAGDLDREFNPDLLVPLVAGVTKFTCKQMKEYFYEIFGE